MSLFWIAVVLMAAGAVILIAAWILWRRNFSQNLSIDTTNGSPIHTTGQPAPRSGGYAEARQPPMQEKLEQEIPSFETNVDELDKRLAEIRKKMIEELASSISERVESSPPVSLEPPETSEEVLDEIETSGPVHSKRAQEVEPVAEEESSSFPPTADWGDIGDSGDDEPDEDILGGIDEDESEDEIITKGPVHSQPFEPPQREESERVDEKDPAPARTGFDNVLTPPANTDPFRDVKIGSPPMRDPHGDASPGSTSAYEPNEPSESSDYAATIPYRQETNTGSNEPNTAPVRETTVSLPPVTPQPVSLGVSAPRSVKPGEEFTATFVAYIPGLSAIVGERLHKMSPRSTFHSDLQTCAWQTGTEVKVRVYGNSISSGEESFIWNGEVNTLSFDVTASPAADKINTVLKFDVSITGFVIAKLRVDLGIDSATAFTSMNTVTGNPATTAFASYASSDRLRVLDRVSEIRRNGVDVFLDCLSLRPGEEWKSTLEREIFFRELFLLFWSANAKQSEWVDWEWRTAFKHKGISGIDPHPLDPVSAAAPPEELRALHFGDMVVDVRKAHEK